MKFYVSIAIDGRYEAEVDAENFEDAKNKAINKYIDADFGELECINCKPVNAEREDGEFKDYD